MHKGLREIHQQMKTVDAIIEVRDARLPISSWNRPFRSTYQHKKVLLILNKADIANPDTTDSWKKYFLEQGEAVMVWSKNETSLRPIHNFLKKTSFEVSQIAKSKGITLPSVRFMVVGVPNTGNMPGVTRSCSWIKVSKGIELFDTPGILSPSSIEKNISLALIHSSLKKIDDYVLIKRILEVFISHNLESKLIDFYSLTKSSLSSENTFLNSVANSLGYIKKNQTADLERAASKVIKDFRDGNITTISLETPEDILDESLI